MESTLLRHGGLIPLLTTKKAVTGFRAPPRNPKPIIPYRVCSVTAEQRGGGGVATGPLMKPAEGNKKTVYHDNWFDRLAIHHLSQAVQSATGMRNEKKGYDSLIEAASSAARRFDPEDQQALVSQALKMAFPISFLKMIRTLGPPSKFLRELFAVFTTLFFPWLVGKCEVREAEFHGRIEKNVVYIHKCRFLEETNCAGMCTNMCKIPSQKFIKDSFGMSVYMAPNFDNMSCEMIFGQEPPEDDPALKQPCYMKLCVAKQTYGANCST